MRKIDVFTHILPEGYVRRMEEVAPNVKDSGKRIRGVPMLVDLDVRFRVMDAFEGYQQILSIATPPIETFAGPSEAIDLARRANDGMAELVTRYPDRFPGFIASLPLNDPDATLVETRRAIDDLGARGVQIFTNVCGRPMTAPEYLPLFEQMARYDLPIWLHPYRGANVPDYLAEDRSLYEIWWTFGWPYETSATMARIVFEGLFDRFPELKIITHHMGAMAPYFAGRLGPGLDQLGARSSDVDYTTLLTTLKRRPIDYFRMFYADTALFGAYDATVCGLRFFGADRVLFASDSPFDPERGPMYIRETIAILDRLEIEDADRQRIYWGNAVRLLKLPHGRT
jgi:predicted TIM-barrel fold metal-dependent hydrolase